MTILIKNVLLVDGTGRPPAKVDVIVKNEKIVALGYFPQYNRADEVIDGLGGAYLAPGFIDINTDADLYLNLFSNPGLENFLLDGVTSIIGGQGGISLAPAFYGSLDLHNLWADTLKVNVNWRKVSEFLETMEKKRIGVNFGTMVGYSTIRYEITGDDFRDLTAKEFDVVKYAANQSLAGGAFGISVDLDFPMTALSPYKEIRTLAELVEKSKKILCLRLRNVSDSSIFNKDLAGNFSSAVGEALNISKETSAKILINNFSCPKSMEKQYEEAILSIEDNSATADIYFDVNPGGISVFPIFAFLPYWIKRGSFKEMRKIIALKENISKIKKDLPTLKYEDLTIFSAPGFEYLIGKSIKTFGQERDLTAKDGLLELMRLTKLRASVYYRNLSVKEFPRAVSSSRAIISSADGGFGKNQNDIPELSSTHRNVIEMSLKNKIIPIEETIKKMTSLPAKNLGISDRGIIREGYFADLVLFRENKIETVIINGKLAVNEGKVCETNAGKILKKT